MPIIAKSYHKLELFKLIFSFFFDNPPLRPLVFVAFVAASITAHPGKPVTKF